MHKLGMVEVKCDRTVTLIEGHRWDTMASTKVGSYRGSGFQGEAMPRVRRATPLAVESCSHK